jgi:hypothetical protein
MHGYRAQPENGSLDAIWWPRNPSGTLLTGTLAPTMINFYQPVPQIASKSRMCTGHVGEPS